jgi:dGTPase
MRAAYACDPERSLGRAFGAPEDGLRSPFQRDRDRIVHSTAFRRLVGKTQVFVHPEGDHFRTRLTHSLEVAQIARTVARGLGVDEDLTEALALAHDLGHSPFGHAGERALDEALAAHGGFNHNLQTFRIVTALERRYTDFDGLDLTFETLEGILKHNGPLGEPLLRAAAAHPVAGAIDLGGQAPVEAQIAALADDVAYCSHDLDDGIRAGFFTFDELQELTLLRPLAGLRHRQASGAEPERIAHDAIRGLIGFLVRDLVAESRRRLAALAPPDTDAVRSHPHPVVAFSAETAAALGPLRTFLERRMYRHYTVNRMSRRAARIVRELVEGFLQAPDCLPERWGAAAGAPGSRATAIAVRDYVAGMTDRYAIDEHERLYGVSRARP